VADGDAVREFRELRDRHGAVLVVDDDEMVRQVVRDLLASRGLRVLAAADGMQALELAARHADEIAVVLLDLVLPLMGGAEVCVRLRHLCPQASIVISSGYPAGLTVRPWAGDPQVCYLAKPYRMDDLLAAVRAGWPEK
jgi:CheY-like chemotaxis protein